MQDKPNSHRDEMPHTKVMLVSNLEYILAVLSLSSLQCFSVRFHCLRVVFDWAGKGVIPGRPSILCTRHDTPRYLDLIVGSFAPPALVFITADLSSMVFIALGDLSMQMCFA